MTLDYLILINSNNQINCLKINPKKGFLLPIHIVIKQCYQLFNFHVLHLIVKILIPIVI